MRSLITKVVEDKQFYPSSEDVMVMMKLPCEGKVVADLSAGKGDILDFCIRNGALKGVACEIEENLQMILQKKGYQLLTDDCLKCTAEMIAHVNLIAINPPFLNAVEHLLHIWEIAPEGCEIVSLCNYDTIIETISDRRKNYDRSKLKSLIEKNGLLSNLGNVFHTGTTVERKADVAVGLVRMFKPMVTDGMNFDDFYFGTIDYGQYDVHNRQNISSSVMGYDEIRATVNRIKGALEIYDKVLELGADIGNLTKLFGIDKANIGFNMGYKSNVLNKIDFQSMLYKKAWTHVFSELNIEKYLTTNVQIKLNKFTEEQQQFPFTVENIYRMLDFIRGNAMSMQRDSIKGAIDYFISLAYNKRTETGWKTNKSNLLNKKFIVDCVATRETWGNKLEVSYSNVYVDRLEDIMKVLYMLKGWNYISKKDSLRSTVEALGKVDSRQVFKWNNIFEAKMFYKGTIHLKFINDKDWEKLNIAYANASGFPIPEFSTKENTYNRDRF